uniref:MYND-type domain-containing protein n=1 Tax=Moniliophthora roreri TaxID=221103 RepID=A0A0W0EZX4_MONRR
MQVVDDFIDEGCLLYPTNTQALSTLRRLGRPPSTPDLEHPSRTLRTALLCIGALASNVNLERRRPTIQRPHSANDTAILIRQNWSSVIGGWVKMFLENFLPETKDFSVPSSLEGRDFLDLIFGILPLLLVYPMYTPDEQEAICELKRISRDFSRLLFKAMLFQVDAGHFSWASWCHALGSVLFFRRAKDDLFKVLDDNFTILKRPVPQIFIHHIHRQCNSVRTWNRTMKLESLRVFMLLFQACANGKSGSAFHYFVFNGGPKALTRLLFTLIVREKTLRDVPEDSGDDFLDAYDVVNLTVECLAISIQISPIIVMESLDGGLVFAILKALRFYRFGRNRENTSTSTNDRVSASFAVLLAVMSFQFVYPSVLRRFIKSMRKANASGIDWDDMPEDQTRVVGDRLREQWTQCKRIAVEMHDIYRGLMESRMALYMCGFPKCPHFVGNHSKYSNEDESMDDIPQYLVCSACKWTWYCSRECARRNWKFGGHRVTCPNIIKSYRGKCRILDVSEYNIGTLIDRNWGQPSNVDQLFFGELGRRYVQQHGEAIFEAMSEYFEGSDEQDDVSPLPLPGTIVVLDFCHGEFLSAKNFSISDVETIVRDKRVAGLSGYANIIRHQSRVAVESEELVVVSFIASMGMGASVPWLTCE